MNAYNPRYLSFAPLEERYRNEVTAWMASLAEMRTWMRGLPARRPVTAQERTLLEREREALRADVAGIQEALRRLEAQRTTSDEERADWEKRYEEATARARDRLKEYLANESFEAAQRLLSMCSGRLTKEIRLKIDKRINVAGGNDPDKERLVKELDAQIKDLVTQRSEVDSAGPALSTAWDAVKKAEAALEPGEEDGSKAEKALEEMRDVVGDALGNPAVQRALRLSEVPALVFTFGKLIADASFDITTELLAFARIGQMDREADAYLEAVARLDEQMKKKVARLQEIERQLAASQ